MSDAILVNTETGQEEEKVMDSIRAVYFSPTGGTKAIVSYISEKLAEGLHIPVEYDDITLPADRRRKHAYTENELLVIGTSVYAGRVPNKIMPDLLEYLEGSYTKAVVISTFGNRSADDANKELRQILEKKNFVPVGSAEIANRHVFSNKIGQNRPDAEDRRDIDQWIRKIVDNLENDRGNILRSVLQEELQPYYRPLGEDLQPAAFLKAKPGTVELKCIHCGLCGKKCPMESISMENTSEITGVCIKCQACVKLCPTDAKYFDDAALLSHIRMLENHYQRRAENHYE